MQYLLSQVDLSGGCVAGCSGMYMMRKLSLFFLKFILFISEGNFLIAFINGISTSGFLKAVEDVSKQYAASCKLDLVNMLYIAI